MRPARFADSSLSVTLSLLAGAALAPWLLACEKSGPLADLDASATSVVSPSVSVAVPVPSPSASPAQPGAPSASAASAAPPDAGRIMPPRPVPTSSPTVLITMPEEVQLRAIQYMAAMQAPQPSDAPADATYAKQIADQLHGVGRPDVISSGRRIDILMEKGCVASLPREAIAHRTSASSLGTLLAHGVLVVRCADRQLQCLQSTRDADDVLCTRK
jgi:hypothetical protein